jgi:hypothetical protein
VIPRRSTLEDAVFALASRRFVPASVKKALLASVPDILPARASEKIDKVVPILPAYWR